jgi:carboxylesterase type B
VQFAKTGNPNDTGLPTWPEFSSGEKLMHLGDSIDPIDPADPTRRAFCEQTTQQN